MTNLFPDFIELKLNNEFIDDIINIVAKYKNDINIAEIYSFQLKDTVISDLRKSLKNSFRDDELKDIVSKRLLFIIKDLFQNNKNCYNIEIGNQSFDYIQYKSGGYFEKHRDFVRINNANFQQYTLLIGLSDITNYDGGSTILWFPLNESLTEDFNKLQTCEDYSILYDLFRKFNISFFNKENLYEKRNLILEKTSEFKLMPKYFKTLKKGEALMFKSDIIHSGEKFYNFEKDKELLMITLNITGSDNKDEIVNLSNFTSLKQIELYPSFQNWMIDYINNKNIFPFQYIICHGDYNDEKFKNVYTTYWDIEDKNSNIILKDINNILDVIYEDTKKKLNKRHREYHIDSKVLDNSTLYNNDFINEVELIEKNINFKWKNFNSELNIKYKDYYQTVDNYIKNLKLNIDELVKVVHKEKVQNYWEESGCNDNGDEYDDITYLNCKIDILYGFYKI